MDGQPPPPPPPPPHGAKQKASGLPPGNYDIFIIPPHSSGSGFLYLPSLQPQRNSFLAGVASTLVAVAVWSVVAPVLKQWLATVVASGGVGVLLLILAVGVGGWAWGKTQTEASSGRSTGPDSRRDSEQSRAGTAGDESRRGSASTGPERKRSADTDGSADWTPPGGQQRPPPPQASQPPPETSQHHSPPPPPQFSQSQAPPPPPPQASQAQPPPRCVRACMCVCVKCA